MGHSRAGVRRRQKLKRARRNERRRAKKGGEDASRTKIVMTKLGDLEVGIQVSDIPEDHIVMSEIDGIPFGIQATEFEIVNPEDERG